MNCSLRSSILSFPFHVMLLILALATTGNTAEVDVWVGTTTPRGGLSKGIYYATFQTDNGELARPRLVAEIDSPGFVALHPDGDVLYSTGTIEGIPSVVAYKIERSNGRAGLTLINSRPIGDGGAAHLSPDRSGRVLMTAQYGGGSTAIYPLQKDMSIGPQSQLLKHDAGSGVVAGRQDQPHAHWVGTSPDNQYVFVPDLGMDKVVIYRLDVEHARLSPHGFGVCPPGSGPRHMKFHPNGKYIYVLNELALSVTAFAYDASAGTMTALQTIPTVSDEAKAKESFVSASEIRAHPTGDFVYAANRGHDTITVFRVDSSTGRLSLVEVEPIRGSWPRNFNLDPTGRWLLAAGRDSNNIALFGIDGGTGELTYTRTMVMVPTPICLTLRTADGQ